jgi:hypothetical protein
MLRQLSPTQDFIVVDRYLLPRSGASDYLETLGALLIPITRKVHHLTLVTSPNYNCQLLTDLIDRVSTPELDCKIVHQTSDVFHDRFWIADRQRGLLVGTSLNGLGRRYALIDYMRETDVRDVVEALVSECLL